MNEAKQFYVTRGGFTSGPFTAVQLKTGAGDGTLLPSHLIRNAAENSWHFASQMPGLFPERVQTKQVNIPTSGTDSVKAASKAKMRKAWIAIGFVMTTAAALVLARIIAIPLMKQGESRQALDPSLFSRGDPPIPETPSTSSGSGWFKVPVSSTSSADIIPSATAGAGAEFRKQGDEYFYGHGVARDYATALNMYTKAADAGDARAMTKLGSMYINGTGTSKNPVEGTNWYRRAIGAGDGVANLRLGYCYADGTGVPKDTDQANAFYATAFVECKKSAELGDPSGMYAVGQIYDWGCGVTKDPIKAAEWYLKGAEGGNPDSMYCAGSMFFSGEGVPKDLTSAISWFRKAAEAGEDDAMRSLGNCYYNGDGIRRDLAIAASWYEKAAATGDAVAMFILGTMYDSGDGVPKDPAAAVSWYVRASYAGERLAMNNLAWHLETGSGVTRDLHKAVQYYRMAADLDYPDAMVALGQCYERGIGVAADTAIAETWYVKAAKCWLDSANNGDAEAARKYGLCCLNGTGVRQDEKQAMEWLNFSASKGSAAARDTIAQINASKAEANAAQQRRLVAGFLGALLSGNDGNGAPSEESSMNREMEDMRRAEGTQHHFSLR